METKMKGTPWWVPGDLNGFFGLFSNVLTNFLAAIGLLLIIKMPNDIVFSRIIPGTAIAIGLGNIILAYQAKELSIKTNRDDVTAMPYGLSVPHYFAVAFGVIAVVYGTTKDWMLAWSAGIAWNVIQGVIMTLGAFVGPYISKYIPRSAMLGSLAGLAVTYIAMNPIGEAFTTPYIGLTSFAIILVGWLALKRMPFNIPAGAFAILVGTLLAWATGYMNFESVSNTLANVNFSYPTFAIDLLVNGFEFLKPFLPAAIPLAIYDFLESLDNLESAAAAGEHYSITKAMLVPGVLTLVGALLGSPYPTIIYIGHPGWKSTGARIGYSWATGVGVIALSFTGLMQLILGVVPLVTLLPILIYIAMVIGTQAFSVTPKRHMPAVILAFLPLIAGFLVLKIKSALGAAGVSVADIGYQALANSGIPLLGWERLAAGDILVGMVISTIVIFLIDRKYKLASIYSLIAAGLSYVGLIHSPEIGFGKGLDVALGYVCFAGVLAFMNYYRKDENEVVAEDEA